MNIVFFFTTIIESERSSSCKYFSILNLPQKTCPKKYTKEA